MSKFYKVDVQGKNWLQRLGAVPAWTSEDEGRILFNTGAISGENPVVVGGSSAWLRAGEYGDVPLGTTLLIDSAVTITGYTILTDQDDKIIYVSKGPGGVNGVGGDNFGTWTQPNHDHTQDPHTHPDGSYALSTTGSTYSLPSHTHPPQSGFGNFMSSSGSTHGEAGDSYGTFANTGAAGSGGSHAHSGGSVTGVSGSDGDTTVDPSATANTWRPAGRNFTRQSRI